jgi:hypothetical protein
LQLTESKAALDVIIVGLNASLVDAQQATVSVRQEGVDSVEAIRKQMFEAVSSSDAVKEELNGRVSVYETRVVELESSLKEMNEKIEQMTEEIVVFNTHECPVPVVDIILPADASAVEKTPFKIPVAITKQPSHGSSSSLRHISHLGDGVTATPARDSVRRDSSVFGSPSVTDSDSRRESGLSDVMTAANSRRESALLEVEPERDFVKNRSSPTGGSGVKRASSSVEALKSDAAVFGSSPSSAKRVRSSPAAASSQPPPRERVFICFSGVSDNAERNRLMNIVSKMPNAEYLECKEGLDPRISK